MGDPACYRDYCPDCDMEVLITDKKCPECGEVLAEREGV
jgi:ribosomal protein S27AE